MAENQDISAQISHDWKTWSDAELARLLSESVDKFTHSTDVGGMLVKVFTAGWMCRLFREEGWHGKSDGK